MYILEFLQKTYIYMCVCGSDFFCILYIDGQIYFVTQKYKHAFPKAEKTFQQITIHKFKYDVQRIQFPKILT